MDLVLELFLFENNKREGEEWTASDDENGHIIHFFFCMLRMKGWKS